MSAANGNSLDSLVGLGPFSVVYADPPWRFCNYNDKTATNWCGEHYPLMDEGAIHALPVAGLCAKDCVLFLWGTWPTLPRAVRTVKAWGFMFKTVAFVWVKTNKDGSPFLGMGYWTRSNTEFCLLATRGSPRRVSCAVPQLVFATRGRHSAKPPEVRDRIVRLMGDVPRVELFARERVQGWEAWGNEVEANTPEQARAGSASPGSAGSGCGCVRCTRESGRTVNGLPEEMTRMIVCPRCGNKRCPHASDHRNACTNSNEPGQTGSIYGPNTTHQARAGSPSPECAGSALDSGKA